jgi:hypothetical protein
VALALRSSREYVRDVKTFAMLLALALLSVTAACAVWSVGSLHRQECLAANFDLRQVVEEGDGRVRLASSPAKPLVLSAEITENCGRWPF